MMAFFKLNDYAERSMGQEEAELAFKACELKWLEVIDAHIIDAHNKQWTDFIAKYEQQHSTLVQYLRDTWLTHKHQFCKAWLVDIPHFGATIISPLKGLHGGLKNWLIHAAMDLNRVVETIKLAVNLQLKRIEDTFTLETTR